MNHIVEIQSWQLIATMGCMLLLGALGGISLNELDHKRRIRRLAEVKASLSPSEEWVEVASRYGDTWGYIDTHGLEHKAGGILVLEREVHSGNERAYLQLAGFKVWHDNVRVAKKWLGIQET